MRTINKIKKAMVSTLEVLGNIMLTITLYKYSPLAWGAIILVATFSATFEFFDEHWECLRDGSKGLRSVTLRDIWG